MRVGGKANISMYLSNDEVLMNKFEKHCLEEISGVRHRKKSNVMNDYGDLERHHYSYLRSLYWMRGLC